MRYFVTLPSGREHLVDIVLDAKGRTVVLLDGAVVEVEASAPGAGRGGAQATSIRIDDRQFELWLEEQARIVSGVRVATGEWGVIANGRRFFARIESEQSRIQAAAKPASAGEAAIRSPMPGRVVRVLVAEGAAVAAGTPVVVVEAMKMENELAAGGDGVVTKVHVVAGASVEGGALLVELGPARAEA
jgi:biotin carboxyl carrier protein